MKFPTCLLILTLLTGCSVDEADVHHVSHAPIVLDDRVVVLIGDSIAEGHPVLHSSLHGGGTNKEGQISFEVQQLIGSQVLNMGIGGNTTSQIKERWERDVSSKKPDLIIIHAGVNDVFSMQESVTIRNIDYFIDYAISNGVKVVISNIGPDLQHNDESIRKSKVINSHIKDLSDIYEEVQMSDYLGWATEYTYDFKHLKKGCFADSVHPNKKGYKEYSLIISSHIN